MSKPMSSFLCKTIISGFRIAGPSPPICILGFLRNPNIFTHSPRYISSTSNQQPFTVYYLTNSIGLSPQTALSVSKHVNFENSEKPDKVLNLFKKYGFTQTQMSSLFRKRPRLLLVDAEKTIFPKLEFFESKGFSCHEMAKMLSVFPSVLLSRLDKQIMPSYDFFRNLFQSEKKLNGAVKRCPDILAQKNFGMLSIDVLRGYGVPDSNIALMFLYQPRILLFSLDRFRENVEEVVKMGFDASKVNFVIAVRAFWSMSKSTWERKVDAYKKWGLSEEEVLKMFKKRPLCMMLSEDKIMAVMDFYINKMALRPCLIAKRPQLLSLSMEKRLMPRYSVFQVLLAKGLVKAISLAVFFTYPEIKFLQKFVAPYKNEAPELLKLYKDKLNLTNGLLAAKI